MLRQALNRISSVHNSYFPANRRFLQTQMRLHSSSSHLSGETVKIHFVDQKGVKTTVQAPIGENILLVAHANDIDLEGACECSLACSTCHVYVDEENFVKLPEPAEEEEDMLDLAYGLTPLSRLGCQILVTKELEGMTVTLPKATRNLQVDKK